MASIFEGKASLVSVEGDVVLSPGAVNRKKAVTETLVLELKTGLCLTVDESFSEHEGWAPYFGHMQPGWPSGQRWLIAKEKGLRDSWRISSALLPQKYLTLKPQYKDRRSMVVLCSKSDSLTQCWKFILKNGSFRVQSCEGDCGVWDVGTADTREERISWGREHDQWLWTWPVAHGDLHQQFMLLESANIKCQRQSQ
ncbi:MAG: hypothetical protein LBB75_02115 [Oscillospiraceae bacterium]|jgi:hypothetical protein|nr:hypothetical protein [Oscillospiraceae bacterium]